MKITIYELLGMIKDGKAPKKIKYENREYFLYDNKSYLTTDKTRFFDRIYFSDLNIEIEILEEEKKIPEKLGYFDLTKNKNEKDENGNDLELHYTGVADAFEDVYTKIDEIIDYLDYLKSKGE